jgi:hypothetical protein
MYINGHKAIDTMNVIHNKSLLYSKKAIHENNESMGHLSFFFASACLCRLIAVLFQKDKSLLFVLQ